MTDYVTGFTSEQTHVATYRPSAGLRSAGRLLAAIYGGLCYAIFLGTFLYGVGFVGNLFVPKSIDSGRPGVVGAALLTDGLLLGLFAAQHSLMARPAFKRWWTRLVPQPIERSTFVLFASLTLILLFWQWRPIGGVIWQVEQPVGRALLLGLYALGWLIVVLGSFLISHFDLFGLRQVYLNLRQQPYTYPGFRTPLLYRYLRHPMMLGFLIAFWATPHMSASHLLFAAGMTAYILIGTRLEERDLNHHFGDEYRRYQQTTPMLIPRLPHR